jgi:hypothetical protein
MIKSKSTALLAVVASSVFLGGCATWSTSSVDKTSSESTAAFSTTTASKQVLPRDVFITDSDIVDRKYSPLGDITVTVNKTTIFHPEPTPELVNIQLKEKGAELGADAVILVRYGKGGISLLSWGSLDGKGRAIKYVQ